MTHWTYWRLYDEKGRLVGWMREASGRRPQYVALVGNQWHWEPIRYADRCALDGCFPGIGYLRGPQCDPNRKSAR